jgi:Lon protease-like protein
VTATPMFPLGMVHFPAVPLPLQVFEPRYRQLTIDCLDGDREFGVVLIERGSEVGGGDARFDVGTMTTIREAHFDDRGLLLLDTVGTRRVRVVRWLEDAPYPRAEVADLPSPRLGTDEVSRMAEVERLVRRGLAMRAELGEATVPFNITLDDDPGCTLFQLAAIAPLGAIDKQRLLEAEPADLLRLLADFMGEQLAVLAHRLAGN